MNRFFLDPTYFSDNDITFPADIAHQIMHVLRLRDGESVEVLDGTGMICQVILDIDSQEKQVRGRIIELKPTSAEPKIRVSLYFGLTNREKVEWILQKGTEIGISDFFPFLSSRTLVQSTELSQKRSARWERIIREAAEQSHRGRLPILHQPRDLAACFAETSKENHLCLMAWEEADPEEKAFGGWIRSFMGNVIALFVGPEGGFSEGEINLGRESGCKIVSLGRRILRMETAAIVFPALVLHEMGEL